MQKHLIAAVLFLTALLPAPSRADALTDALVKLQGNLTVPLAAWKVHQPDVPGGEKPDFNDAGWQAAPPEYTWHGPNTSVWFRTRITIPAQVNGLPTNNAPLRLQIWVDDDGDVYVNGKFREHFHWDEGNVTIAEHVQPGQTYTIAVRGINGPGDGTLHYARLSYGVFESLPGYQDFLQEADFVSRLVPTVPAPQQATLRATLSKAEGQVNQDALRQRNLPALSASLLKAHGTLMTLKSLTRQYQVFYVGHAHIDMNWLWTWPETVDVCHRTWDSAMNLMDRFPDFGYVQSQPAAYAAIRQTYPDEFARMQRMSQKGQWGAVGGLWDESDTNMPSGEGLARSLFLGQRYFKTNFGRYATTGWLPDSFGHSWQMPQLMQGAGIQDFYHMRCGDGVRFSWWQSPDGSRVLKANTDNYDAPVTSDQLAQPWANERDYGLKQALVVFGVGDHGGGPTRRQIEQGKTFQRDSLLPQVKFATGDAFFRQLRAQKQTADLPVLDHDLQYTFVGCYTTHADLKKSVRENENALYAGEVWASLAAMRGQPYPVQGFSEAWKPAAFAQFHDIMCGSAIHSTYDWMRGQFAPAEAFERAQTQRALGALTNGVDTRGARADERPVVVWNALSFPRSDIVRVSVPGASRVHSARDGEGHRWPVQVGADGALTFVARNVPAFGHQAYCLSAETAPPVGLSAREDGARFVLENDALRVGIDRATGLMTELYDKKSGRQMLAPGQAGNALQLLGDSGSAWDINYTGINRLLTEPDAQVSLVASGPVGATVRVRRTFGASASTQDVTLYGGLDRVDVPTTVDWHEHGQLLKVAFPLDMAHPAPHVGIPYGSIDRPDNGQENPGQKWMDVTDERPGAADGSAPLDLHGLFNQDSARRFDGENFSFDPALFPAPGRHTLGRDAVAFDLPAHAGPDNVACAGQTLTVPAGARGDTLYLLGAGAPGVQGGSLTFVQADGRRTRATFTLGDWVAGAAARNDTGATFPDRLQDKPAARDANAPHLWITSVPLPSGSRVSGVILPDNPKCHLFAATVAQAPHATPLFGLTVLNDSKYGSDTNNNVFRLTLLRSSHDPDPNPDEGTQAFTYALLPHGGDWRAARSEQAGLALNVPLRAVPTSAHPGAPSIGDIQISSPDGDIVVGALKHCEDGPGYILRFFETQGKDTTATLTFPGNVRVQETDLLERPVQKRRIAVTGRTVGLPVGHDQIVTLHVTGLPDAGTAPLPPRAPAPVPVVNGLPAPDLAVLAGSHQDSK